MSLVQPSHPGGVSGVMSSACDGMGSDGEECSVLLLSLRVVAPVPSPWSVAGEADSGIWNSFNGF